MTTLYTCPLQSILCQEQNLGKTLFGDRYSPESLENDSPHSFKAKELAALP